jgi:phenylacetate-CoA ligase
VLASQSCGERFLLWHGIGPDEILAQMDSENRGRIDRRADLDLSSAPPVGRRRLHFDIGLPGQDAHAWLEDVAVRHVTIMPSFARAMAQDVLSGRKAPIPLDTVICYGEGLEDETRRAIRSAFGARVLNRYACEETGAIGLECPAGGLHVQSEIVRVEILDDDGRPVPPGVEGRVALTAIYNYAMPLIRYVIGDRATLLEEPCSCGCALPCISPVIGRQRHIFRFADGSQVWPSITPSVLRRHLPFRQMRFLQRALDRIEMLYVPEGDTVADFEAARAFILSRLVPDLQVTFTAVDEIPRLPGGKYLDYMALIDPAQS